MLCLTLGMPTVAHAREQAVVPGEALVRFRDNVERPRAAAAVVPIGVSVQYLPAIHLHRLRLRPGVSLDKALAYLRGRQDVLYAAPNHIVHLLSTPNDTYYLSDQYGPAIMKADRAWGIWNPQASVTIAVVDTGVDSTHPDLTNKILRDAQGVVGYNALIGSRDTALDDFGHGTHCAGIAAAQVNNGIGVAGIAGWNGNASATDTADTKIMPIKVLDATGSGTDVGVADGMIWAADHGARVLSLSIGGSDYSYPINSAVAYAWDKGCVVIAAAGNDQVSGPLFPAACVNAIAVAATNSTDSMTWFSSYGDWVPVAAPGEGIISTLIGGVYGKDSGTSMSTPHVAGEAALLLAQNPSLTNYEVRNLIVGNTDPYTPYSGRMIAPGGGRVNAYNALLSAFNPPPPNPMKAYLFSAEDAYVESGTNADTNFGDMPSLIIQKPAGGPDDVAYMKLDLTGLTTPPSSAQLILTQDGTYTTPAGSHVTLKLYDIPNTSWVEKTGDSAGVTWNTAPGLNRTNVTSTGTLILSQDVTLQAGSDVTLDLTAYIAAHLGQVVTIQFINETTQNATLAFYSREQRARTPIIAMMLNPAKVNVAGKVTLSGSVNAVQPITFAFRPVGGGTAITFTQTLSASGAFTLKDVPAGSYSLAIKGSKWLQKAVPVNTTAGSVFSVNVTLLPGDINNDNKVNIVDLGLLADSFGRSQGQTGYNANADLNGDDAVNIIDLGLMADNFGKNGDP
jgi:thermitase